ncbi:unnamed protein product [Macrosiphum euphorbiae]|uniref:Uncharacterized protein n=1 Tax=Macrosiphum euphorbiae TaxID=13131 RepID=A0AAV0XHT8_9HEMI|nr:unnamed protein product [Macrosiphum euphorbiae]
MFNIIVVILQKNSLVTVPVIQDGDFVLPGSHAIIVYLVREYGGEDNPLYPNEPKIQAQVNQRLFFDSGIFYPAFKNQYNPYIYHTIEKTKETEDKMHESLMFLENVLKESTWTAGDSMTVADFSLVASISTLQVLGVDLEMYDFINEWFIRCSKIMCEYERANQVGIDLTRTLLKYSREASEDLNDIYSL